MYPDDNWNALEMDQAIRAYHSKMIAPILGKLPKVPKAREDSMEYLRESYVKAVYQSPVAIWAIAKWWAKEGNKVSA